MTTIIGIEKADGCSLVADSRVTDPAGRIFSHSAVTKINKRGAFLIAGAGEVVPCDIAQHIWNPPVLTEKDKKDVYHFMIAKVMPSLRKSLIDNGYSFDDAGENRFNFILAVNGELFDIDQDLAVCKNDDGIYAVGSGADFAIGALHAGATPMQAMAIAAKVSAYTAPPFVERLQKRN
jgi:ATP-dependent protease HslVU (ClpYQ) peptidase subunit